MKLKEFLAKKKPHKYRAKPVRIDGRHFASTLEGKRYAQLKILEKAGKIADLECQPELPIAINSIMVCKYRADFAYRQGGEMVYEDCKGFRTPVYRLKRKLVRAVHGIEIKET